jgi:hypothetical protein
LHIKSRQFPVNRQTETEKTRDTELTIIPHSNIPTLPFIDTTLKIPIFPKQSNSKLGTTAASVL